VNVRVLEDAASFLDEAGPLLLEDEARNNLILGIAGTAAASPDRYPEKRFWVATDDGEPVAAALRTPPFNLVLARPRDEAALEALAAGIEEELPGVVAAHPEVDAFTRLWSRAHEVEPRVIRDQGVYALERVQPLPGAPGTSRVATRDDAPLLLAWMLAFGLEVLDEGDPGRAEAQDIVEHRLGDRPRQPDVERDLRADRLRPRLRVGDGFVRAALEKFLQLHCGAHVSLDLQLSRHVRRGRVLLALHDLLECVRGRGDRAVAARVALVDGDAPVRHLHRPGARALDVEDVRVVHAGRLGRVDPGGQAGEEIVDRVGHLFAPCVERTSREPTSR
jgi:hypothetical protein